MLSTVIYLYSTYTIIENIIYGIIMTIVIFSFIYHLGILSHNLCQLLPGPRWTSNLLQHDLLQPKKCTSLTGYKQVLH